jgi:hypothetical protein
LNATFQPLIDIATIPKIIEVAARRRRNSAP